MLVHILFYKNWQLKAGKKVQLTLRALISFNRQLEVNTLNHNFKTRIELGGLDLGARSPKTL